MASQNLSILVSKHCETLFGPKECREVRIDMNNVWYGTVVSDPSYTRTMIGTHGHGVTYKTRDIKETFVLNDFIVVENSEDITARDRSKCVLRLDTDNCHSGYCSLEQLPGHFLEENVYETYNNGVSYLSSGKFLDMCVSKSRQGTVRKDPYAVTRGHHFLYCLPLKLWPRRSRLIDENCFNVWPNNATIRKLRTASIVLCPIGYRTSTKKDIEWQISFCHAEVILANAWPNIIAKLFQLLRLTFKEGLNTARAKNLLCSHVLRNLLFWMMEQDLPNIINDASLEEIFVATNLKLLGWIESAFAPHFFMPHCNLFHEADMELSVINEVKAVISTVVRHGLKYIFNLRSLKCIKVLIDANAYQAIPRERIALDTDLTFLREISGYSYCVLPWKICLRQMDNIRSSLRNEEYSEVERGSLLLGYLQLASCAGIKLYRQSFVCNVNKHRVLFHKLSKHLLTVGRNCDVTSGKLQLASYFYLVGQYQSCCTLLNDIEKKVQPFTLYVKRVGGYVSNTGREQQYQMVMLNSQEPLHVKARRAALVDMEIYKEFPLCPTQLLLDVTLTEDPPNIFSVPFYAYLYFLRYLCFAALSDSENQSREMDNLKTLMFDVEHRGEGPLSFNMCGVCAETQGDYSYAFRMYTKGFFASRLQHQNCTGNSSQVRIALLLRRLFNV